MNALEALLELPEREKERGGLLHTPAEIAQQPDCWAKTARLVRSRRDEIRHFMVETGLIGEGRAVLILSGAGSSEFIGSAVANVLKVRLQREVLSVPTTHLVTHSADTFISGHRYVLLSFSRSGRSPESIASYKLADNPAVSVRNLVVTCKCTGPLAELARVNPRALTVILPEETDDRSLVMTSAFTSMALASIGLGFLDDLDRFEELAELLGQAARRVFAVYADLIRDFSEIPFTRACFLGSNTLTGTMQECQLKMLEMTDGEVASRHESFLGLRHGPQVFVNSECVVVAALSSDPGARPYELDMLRELRTKEQGAGILVICDRWTSEIGEITPDVIELFPEGKDVHDRYRIMTDVIVGQLLGLFKGLNLGLQPDAPSARGTINRVVQGVTIYG